MTQFIGYLVSIECKNAIYQGIVCDVDLSSDRIKLFNSFKNGMQCGHREIEINSNEIDNIEILADSRNAQTYLSKSQVKSNANKTQSITNGDATHSHTKSNHSTSRASRTNTMNSMNSCFSSSTNLINTNDDFDFEKNLALFDKQAFTEHMCTSTKVTTIEQPTNNTAKLPSNYQPLSLEALFSSNKQHSQAKSPHLQQQRNYRCDEMILDPGEPIQLSQIKLPFTATKTYTTDNGLKVPCITNDLKNRLFEEAFKHGYTKERLIESMGHSCAEMACSLLGGQNRFHPKNNHQKPKILVLADNEMHGAYAICVARFLSVRSCHVYLYQQTTTESSVHKQLIENEVKLCKLTDTCFIQNVDEIKSLAIDLIINGLDCAHNSNAQINSQLWYRSLIKYLSQCKANVLGLDPTPNLNPINALQSKYSIVPVLPQHMNTHCGRIYLCDLGFSPIIFEKCNIKYQSPFGAKFLIPLYDD